MARWALLEREPASQAEAQLAVPRPHRPQRSETHRCSGRVQPLPGLFSGRFSETVEGPEVGHRQAGALPLTARAQARVCTEAKQLLQLCSLTHAKAGA